MRTFAISFLAALTSAMLTAPTVHADDQDDYLLQNLESYGVPASAWGDEDRAIDVAKEACDLAASGYRQNEVIMSLISDNSDKSSALVQQTVSVGILSYCPEALDRP
jgi:hypothetical protein